MASVSLGKIFDIRINLHYTWFFILALLAFSLATDYFPSEYPGYTTASYWIYGGVAGILLFACVLAHELSHSLVAKSEGMEVRGITLFFFGGVANASEEGLTPGKEFRIAIAGPVLSVALGGLFYLLTLLPAAALMPILDYLFMVNLVLAAFNMIPGFPLDGGRVFRSAAWKATGSLRRATQWASNLGKLFGAVLVIIGIINFTGAGLWYILLGGFLYLLAGASYEQVVIKGELETSRVKTIMNQDVTVLEPEMSIEQFVENHVKRFESRFVVKDKGNFYVIDFDRIKSLARHEWPVKLVKDVMVKASPARESHDGWKAFINMQEQGLNMLPVVKKGKVTGVISLKDLR